MMYRHNAFQLTIALDFHQMPCGLFVKDSMGRRNKDKKHNDEWRHMYKKALRRVKREMEGSMSERKKDKMALTNEIDCELQDLFTKGLRRGGLDREDIRKYHERVRHYAALGYDVFTEYGRLAFCEAQLEKQYRNQ